MSDHEETEYDELYVTAEFDHGEIAGYIDHLIVTPEEYHIIDYKTGDTTPGEIDTDVEYYLNQMKPYAVALHQQDPDRHVDVSLVFTGIDDVRSRSWSPGELDAVAEEIEHELQNRSSQVDQ